MGLTFSRVWERMVSLCPAAFVVRKDIICRVQVDICDYRLPLLIPLASAGCIENDSW